MKGNDDFEEIFGYGSLFHEKAILALVAMFLGGILILIGIGSFIVNMVK